ncbi:hypothetical protein [Kitasatospora sp. NPDC088783]|uniref:hypothetical protein n=1 Tax=Kitasatospora sp. NPDC088783 TaxID=3364077 RepID=UPI00380650BE
MLMIRGCLAEARTRRDDAPADGVAASGVFLDNFLRVLGPACHATRALRNALRESRPALPSTTYNELLTENAKAERSGRAVPAAG